MNWIALKDQLPPKNVGVLVSDGVIVTAAQWSPIFEGKPWWSGHEFSGYEWEFDFSHESITHWMPLPEPPTTAGDARE